MARAGKAQFIGTCVDNPFKTLDRLNWVIDNATEITKATFMKHCSIEDNETLKWMMEYPRDYRFYRSGTWHPERRLVYFYTWSAIEHFYMV